MPTTDLPVPTTLERSTGVTHPLVLLQAAIDRGIDPDKLGKLMDLCERWEANQAAKAYAEALTGFKSEMPMVVKRREAGKDGSKVKFKYASIDDIKTIADPLLAKYGIVDSYTTEDMPDGQVKIFCTLQVGVHISKPSEIKLPIPPGVVNNVQLKIQATSYGKRIAFCFATGITLTDQDNDGHGLEDYISNEQIGEINDLLEQLQRAGQAVKHESFLAWLDVDGLDKLTPKGHAKAVDWLKKKLTENGKKAVKA